MKRVRTTSGTARLVVFLISMFICLPTRAEAHVKWFCGPVDIAAPPVGLRTVLSQTFLSNGVLFIALVAIGSMVDRLVMRRWPVGLFKGEKAAMAAEIVIRVGVAVYAASLWRNMAVVPWGAGADGSILTAELLANDRVVSAIQLGVALTCLVRPLSLVTAAGLIALYGMGVSRYGLFHMLDYVFFLGLAAYIALSDPYLPKRFDCRRWRVPIVTAALSFSLMWTAIEKFLYPRWTSMILLFHPDITLGYPISFVVVMAGFVEFSLAFYLLLGSGLILRLNAIILGVIFMAAMPEFGMLDVIGHVPIIVILVVVIIHGQALVDNNTVMSDMIIVRTLTWSSCLYVLTLISMMALYYGMQAAHVATIPVV